ncbi:MAG: hypothetical protein ACRDXX_11020 [Stackebrandtia sp.]
MGTKTSDENDEHREPWMYRDGEFTKLDVVDAGDSTVPLAINDDGLIVGNSSQYLGDGEELPVSVLQWDSESGEVAELNLQDGKDGFVADVNETGTAIGYQADEGDLQGGSGTPWLWDTATGADKPLRGGSGAGYVAVSESWAMSSDFDGHVYRWDLTLDASEPEKMKLDSAGAVDSNGAIYGWMNNTPAKQDVNGVTELPGLYEDDNANTGVGVGHSGSVDDDGSVAIGTFGDSMESHAIVWKCE